MKRISIKATMSLVVILLLTAACTDELNDHPADTGRPIAFTPVAETRAAVEGSALPSGSSFSVWGWYGTGNEINKNVFDGNTVTESGGTWGDTGGTQYWIPGMTYNFYGVYPASVTASVTNDGTITITNFDCSATGTNAVDLMTATVTGLSGDDAPTVAMEFQHQLSKVNIVATVEGGNCTVTSATFSGMVTKGSYSSSAGWTGTTTGSFTNSEPKVLDTTGIDLLDDLLLIPQTVTDQFKITVSYTLDGVQMSKEITLPNSISQWDAGQSYKYTLTFKGNNIIFTVNVASWNHSTGGIITVE